eukprot:12197607-Karenia_brevis.AAC.1
MPSLARYDWLISQLQAGRTAIISASPALQQDRVKVRIRLFDDEQTSPSISAFALAPMLMAWRPYVATASV